MMTVENRELYDDLEHDYPQYFIPKTDQIVYARGCGKTIMRSVFMMQYYYTQIFKLKLDTSKESLTRKEYEDNLKIIENMVWSYYY